ncbi:D-glycerate dehydrogenase [Saccharomonospora sp. CUA-673]|uniref:2-hydroxyacid dehydrogenase n=1 Tax=Saccharomonospora sp. CUA-673 TaxID=1904969 RepID=UPI00095C8FC7|nr:D-glycerate dehydrogenase [Saccharomonospora sp. CUA-673]OLT41378.1 D-glycerate dehydrogenase [Saccharomonospora sp. CUA-673]
MTGSRPRIVVCRWIPDEALALLREAGDVWVPDPDRALPPGELHEVLAGADAAVTTLSERVDGTFADAAGPQLKVVANVAVGYDNVDVPALAERGVTVTNTPGVLTDATADIAFGLLLSATRRLGEGERLLRARTPWSFHLGFMLGTGIQGATLGVIGLGQIGRAMATRARAFGMNIVYSGRRQAPADVEAQLEATYLPQDELLRTADIVSLHCPLTPETRHLIDADALAAMKPTAFLINTTRGPVVDEAALAAALRDGVIAGAGLDVFEQEPDVHPGLLELDNVAMAPHLGSATVETRTAMATLAARNALAVLAGEPALTEVTP